MEPKISILMLTYNANKYVKHTLKTLKKTKYSNYELIVYDNNSNEKLKNYLRKEKESGQIDKLYLSPVNNMFIKGNNEAFKLCDPSSDLVLLLNSDIEIRNENWLTELVKIHRKGITATHICSEIDYRPDGWCLLVDFDLFSKYKLDENKFKVYYSVADLCRKIMDDGLCVQTIRNYKNFINHFGGASGPFIMNGNVIKPDNENKDDDMINAWFSRKCDVLEEVKVTGSTKKYWIFNIYNIFVKGKKHLSKRGIGNGK